MNNLYQSQLRLQARVQAVRMPTFGSNIELGSTSPISKPKQPQKSQDPQHYQPQEDDEDELGLEFPQEIDENPPGDGICARIQKDKGVKLIILLILCLHIIDFGPVYRMGHDMFEFREGSIKKRQDPGALRFMSANLNADPIMDIQIMEKGSTCPSGYKRLKIGTWPGTVAGCLCENGDLHRTSCEKVGSEKCNKDIEETWPIDMYEWDDSIWCVKRAVLGTDYVREAKCPFASKECYIGGCFAGDCPITKMIEVGADGDLLLTRTQGELPIVNIQATFGDIPCFTQEFSQQTVKNSSYALAAIKQDKCDKYGLNDHFSTKIASQTASHLFPENSFQDLPYFEESLNGTTAILSSMTRMKVAKHDHCLEINEKPLNNFTDVWQNYTLFIFILFLIFLTISLRCISSAE